MKYKIKFKTIWHYAIAFFETVEELEDASCFIEDKPFYKGEIKKLSYKKASKIAQIHPGCLKYWEFALMPLFQGKGKLSTGTENPVMALESYKTNSEEDMQYILIWKIYQ